LDESIDHYKIDNNYKNDKNHDDKRKIDSKKNNHNHDDHNNQKEHHNQIKHHNHNEHHNSHHPNHHNDDNNHHTDNHSNNNDDKNDENNILANKFIGQIDVTPTEKKDLKALKIPHDQSKKIAKLESNLSGNKVCRYIAHYNNDSKKNISKIKDFDGPTDESKHGDEHLNDMNDNHHVEHIPSSGIYLFIYLSMNMLIRIHIYTYIYRYMYIYIHAYI
jgi:hypothetical protein